MGTPSTQLLSAVVSIAVILFGFGYQAAALKCLQCYSSHEDGGDCHNDVEGLTYSAMGLNATYNKTCDPSKNQNVCMIEKIENKAGFVSFHRDCSDGALYSFTGQLNNESYRRLVNLRPDNSTTCMFYFQYQAFICISLCNQDFCNGPRPPENDTCVEEGWNASCSAIRPSPFLLPPGRHGVLSNVLLAPLLAYVLVAALLF